MYIYESHMGGLYATDHKIPYEQLYCEECGDSDSCIGEADSAEEAWALLKPNDLQCLGCEEANFCERECEKFGENYYGMYALGYVLTFISETFGVVPEIEIAWRKV